MKPLNNNVLIEIPDAESVTASGIHLPGNKKKKKVEEGVVIDAGTATTVKKGDTIYFKNYSVSRIEKDDKTYGFIPEDELLAVA